MRFIYSIFLLFSLLFSYPTFANDKQNIPILCYHNFNPTKPGSMNFTPQKFEAELIWLKQHGFTIIPLKEAVEYLQGTRTSLPERPIVITADDGWQSQYIYLLPLVKKYNIPVALFIYPGTISEGKHAMTWEELKSLQQTGLFDIQGHTYTHPNFKHAKKNLSPANYEKFVEKELGQSKHILETKLGKKIDFLAWPFGIYDPYLEQEAKKAGYVMSFTIDYRPANRGDRPMAQPRFMIVEPQTMASFASIVTRQK